MASIISQHDTEHSDMVHDAQMDYYGTRLATCSSDKTIRIFSTTSGSNTLLDELKGHSEPVWQISWAHPSLGKLLASCSYDRKVIIWEEKSPNKWENVYEYQHKSSVNSISWSSKEFGVILAAGSSDGSISIHSQNESGTWDYKLIPDAHAQGCNAVCWRPSVAPSTIGLKGSQLKEVQEDAKIQRIVSGGCDNLVKIWKFEANEEKWVEDAKLGRESGGHSDWVTDVAWAPAIGIPCTRIASCSRDGTVLIWSNEHGKKKWAPRKLYETPLTDTVWHVSWSLMGHVLSVSSGDNDISLWKENLAGEFCQISIDQQQ